MHLFCIVCIFFFVFSLWLGWDLSCNCKTKVILNYWLYLWLYLSGDFETLIRRDSAKFENEFLKSFKIERLSWVKVLSSSIALKLEITILFDIPREFRDFHNSLGLPIVSESFSLKNACFFVVINFEASYLAFLYNSLSILSLDFLNVSSIQFF